MYYIVYPLLYLLSLLPWRVIYFISDGLYGLVYYIIGYRKEVVMNNLAIAFPEKPEEERKKIAKEFYHQFIDSLVEMIKLISISKKELQKRHTINAEIVNDYYDKTDRIEMVTGHFFNWEFANLGISLETKIPLVTVYMPLSNKIFDKIIYKMRSRFGAKLVAATKYKTQFHQYTKNKYNIILVADQNPGNPKVAYWMPFFGKMAPLVKGPEKGAKTNNRTVFYAHFYRVKRGYYKTEIEFITDNPNNFAEGELTKVLIKKIEESIRRKPAGYLWSHKRWKHAFDESKYGNMVIK